MLHRRALFTFAVLLASSCAPIDVGDTRAPIIGGTRETGHPEVVAIYVMTPGASWARSARAA